MFPPKSGCLLVVLVLAIQVLSDGARAAPPAKAAAPPPAAPVKAPPPAAKKAAAAAPKVSELDMCKPKAPKPVLTKPSKIKVPIDLLFIVDKSKDVTSELWEKEKQFMVKTLDFFEIGANFTQVALTEFWSMAYNMFAFKDYDNMKELDETIMKNSDCEGCTGKSVNISAALTDSLSKQLTAAEGMRPDAWKIVVIVTSETPEDKDDVQKILRKASEIPKLRMIVCGVGEDVNKTNVGYMGSKDELALFYDNFTDLVLTGPAEVARLSLPPHYKAPIDLAIVMDISTDQPKVLELAKTFLRGVVNQFVVDEVDVKVALVTYGQDTLLQWGFNKYPDSESLDKALAEFKCDNCTKSAENIGEALRFVRKHVFISKTGCRLHSKNIVMVFTDGKAKDEEKLKASATLLADSIHAVLALGVGEDYSKDQLKIIASDPDLVYTSGHFRDLQGTEDIVAQKIYKYALLPRPKCDKAVDMLFVMDKSGSLKKEEYDHEKEFVENVIQHLDVGPQKVQVGMLLFAVDPYPQWNFNKYKNDADLEGAVKNLECLPKGKCQYFKTNTAEALNFTKYEMFTQKRGMRPDAKQVVVVLTDGHSTSLDKDMTAVTADLKKSVAVIAVGVGDIARDPHGEKELGQIASDKKYVTTVPEFEDLPFSSRFAAMKICKAAN